MTPFSPVLTEDHFGDHLYPQAKTTSKTTTAATCENPMNKGQDHLQDHPRPPNPGEGVEGGPCKGTTPTPHLRQPSQSLTTPQPVRYSTPMATRWTTEQRTHALDQLRNGQSPTGVAKATGIPRRTIAQWATDNGIHTSPQAAAKTERARLALAAKWAEVRAEVADEAGTMAKEAAAEMRRLLADGDYLNAQRLVAVFGVSVDKAQLLTGSATERTEVHAPDRSPDLEVEAAKVLRLVQGEAAA